MAQQLHGNLQMTTIPAWKSDDCDQDVCMRSRKWWTRRWASSLLTLTVWEKILSTVQLSCSRDVAASKDATAPVRPRLTSPSVPRTASSGNTLKRNPQYRETLFHLSGTKFVLLLGSFCRVRENMGGDIHTGREVFAARSFGFISRIHLGKSP